MRIATNFLTIFFPNSSKQANPSSLGKAALYFPMVGIFIGILLTLSSFASRYLFENTWLASIIVVSLWVVITGGLHLDGLIDCWDGLSGAASIEKRLEIMRDPRMGAFGGIGLVLHLLLKTAALASIPTKALWAALLFSPVLARWVILVVARQPSARPEGLGVTFKAGLDPKREYLASILPLVLCLLGGWIGIISAVISLLAVYVLVQIAKRRIGGITGDVLGFTIELSELMVLLGFAIHRPALFL